MDGVAVVSAILAKQDITSAARNIKEIFCRGRRKILHGIEGAIFDLDGTLFDSMAVWRDIDLEFLGKRGIAVPPDYMEAVSAKSFYECAVYTAKRFSLPETPEQLMQEWYEMAVKHYESSIELLPHAEEYIKSLKKEGIKLAVATSLRRDFFEPCLVRHGLWEQFDAICSVDDVGCGKESPEIFRYAANRLGIPLSRCVIFDDAYVALQSAKQTEAFVVGVYEKNSERFREKIRSAVDLYIEDLSEAPLLKCK